jgi:hypothetical protein
MKRMRLPHHRDQRRSSETVDHPVPRYFFVHVMKTGGRTLLRHLRDNFELDEMYPYGKLDLRFDGDTVDIWHHLAISQLLSIPEERRRRIRIYSGHYPYVASELLGDDFTTITVLRSPLERSISVLRQFRRKDPWADPNMRHAAPGEGLTLEEVYDNADVFDRLVHNHQTKIFSTRADDVLNTFTDVLEVDEARLELAKANLAKVDIIGITEQYNDFLDELNERTGWHIQRELRKNVTPAEEIQPVSESLRQRIIEDNALDIEFYEYAKQLIASRRASRS